LETTSAEAASSCETFGAPKHDPNTHKAEVENLQKKLAEASDNLALAKASEEISEWSKTRLEKNVEELRESKEKCFKKSLDCVKTLKSSFSIVGAYSSEENFI
jgi:hypothetical protein